MPDQWPYEQIETHVDDARGRFTSQYAEAELLKGFSDLWAERIQSLEDAAWSVLTERWVPDAIGQQLDELGEIVGEPRLDRGDETYRSAIRLRIILNRSGGEPESVIRFVRQAFDAEIVAYTEIYPAKVEIYARIGSEGASDQITVNGFELSDGNLLELSDGSTLDVTLLSRDVLESQVDRIREILPAGVGTLYFVESGENIVFGTTEFVGGESFELSDGDTLALDTGDTLEVFDATLGGTPPDYVAGLGELGIADFELQLSDEFGLELDDGSTFGVTDQIDYIEGTAPRGVVSELFEVE